jgi:hypothetical protein
LSRCGRALVMLHRGYAITVMSTVCAGKLTLQASLAGTLVAAVNLDYGISIICQDYSLVLGPWGQGEAVEW